MTTTEQLTNQEMAHLRVILKSMIKRGKSELPKLEKMLDKLTPQNSEAK